MTEASSINPHGLIVIDKPPGPTAYDCIRFLRRTCGIPRKWKMGHLGTLDPFASGVMVIGIGQVVRYFEHAPRYHKTYRARLFLGDQTDTLDPTGNVVNTAPVPDDWPEKLEQVREKFTGEIVQHPPIFSAKQVDGKRAYKAARKGEKIELKPASVTIFSLEFGEPTENWIDFTCEVSSGTYIRALGRDIAIELGTLGHLAGLERLSVGPFMLEQAIPFSAFEVGGVDVLSNHIRPVEQILSHLPLCTIREGVEMKLIHGQPMGPDDIETDFPRADESTTLRIHDRDGRFRALGRLETDPDRIVPFRAWPLEQQES